MSEHTRDLSFFSDYRQLLACSLDAVFVCTTNDITAEVVVTALDAGIHVFAEKPPGRSLAEACAIRDAGDRNPGLKLKFGFNHRYHESVRDALAIVQQGRLGRLLWMRGLYGKAGGTGFEKAWRNDRARSGGGILIDQGIHMLDLFRLFGGEFDVVKSLVGTHFWPIDVEDNAFVLLRGERGHVAMLHSSSTHWKHLFQLDISLSQGYLSIQGILSNSMRYAPETLVIGRRPADGDDPSASPREEVNYYTDDVSWQLELDEFAHAIIDNAPITTGTSLDAVQVMMLVESAYRDDAHASTATCNTNVPQEPLQRTAPSVGKSR